MWEPRVLVVDDDPVVRLAAGRLLERLGLSVDVAVDGREAVARSAQWPYGAIFMDCYMPDGDGYETTRAIQLRDGQDARPLIIAVTSRPRHVCLAAGMDHHIAKPVRLEVLEHDCRRLGLLEPTVSPEDLAVAERIVEAVGAAPVFAPPVEMAPERAGELALAFVARMRRRLPRLWRAANAADRDALLLLAEDLGARARSVRADRLAALLEEVENLCRDDAAQTAAALEPAVRAQLETLAVAAGEAREGVAPERDVRTPAPPTTPLPLRVAVADDDPLARTAIEAMIRRGDGLELVGSAAGADEIVALADDAEPDVVVVDFVMPGGGGPAAARRIRERRPATQVIALSASESPETYLAMLQAGACGLLVKGTSPARLVELIHRAAQRGA